jgi:hypothetical protein
MVKEDQRSMKGRKIAWYWPQHIAYLHIYMFAQLIPCICFASSTERVLYFFLLLSLFHTLRNEPQFFARETHAREISSVFFFSFFLSCSDRECFLGEARKNPSPVGT